MSGSPAGFPQNRQCPRLCLGQTFRLVKPISAGQYADDGQGTTSRSQLAQKPQFRRGIRPPSVHDKDQTVSLEAFLIGKIIVKRIRGIQAGSIHQHHAGAQRLQRQSHGHPGHKRRKTPVDRQIFRNGRTACQLGKTVRPGIPCAPAQFFQPCAQQHVVRLSREITIQICELLFIQKGDGISRTFRE